MLNKMEEIALVTTDELIDELKRRHPDGVIVAMQYPEHEVQDSGNEWRISFGGSIDTTLKLSNLCLWQHQMEYLQLFKRE